MADYGITQVDVPGLLQLYEGTKRSRLEDLYRQKQFEREQMMAKREDEEYGRKETARTLISQGAKPEEVIAADPESGFKYADHAAKLSEAERAQIERRAATVGNAATYLSELPEAEMLAQWAPVIDQLVGMGYTDLSQYRDKPNRAALGPLIAASKEAVQAYTTGQRARRDESLRERQLGISQGNLDLARQRESRVRQWGPQPLIGMVGSGGIPGGRGQDDVSDLGY